MGLEPAFPPTGREGEDRRRTYSYLVSASFVKFLIHNHGQSQFKALYDLTPLIPMETRQADPARYHRIYGKSLTELQTGWRSWLSKGKHTAFDVARVACCIVFRFARERVPVDVDHQLEGVRWK